MLFLVVCCVFFFLSLLIIEGKHVHVWRGSNPWGNLAPGPDTQGDRPILVFMMTGTMS